MGSLWNYYRDKPNSGAKGDINYLYIYKKLKLLCH